MTNKEKAKEITSEFSDTSAYPALRIAAEEMAEWKDEQFKKYLEKRLSDYKNSIHTEVDAYDYGYMDALKEVIKEFFGK